MVIKPSVGAGALGAGRWRADDPAAERALATILESGDALVQPYLREIESGETSVVVLDGQVTHAVAKVPAAGDFRVQLHHGGVERAVEPTPEELELGGLALAAAGRVGADPVRAGRLRNGRRATAVDGARGARTRAVSRICA